MVPGISSVSPGSTSSPTHTSASPVRIPKLTYRDHTTNSSSSTDEIQPVSKTSSSHTHSNQQRAAEPDVGRVQSISPTDSSIMRTDTRQIDWAVQPTTRKAGPTTKAAEVNDKKAKKIRSSFFDFLTVKEPTSGALDQYAKQQKRQAAEKGTKFMVGVSSQRIPANVPKVNSKWDGLPETARGVDSKRTSGSATSVHRRRDSNATDNSSSRLSRRSRKSTTSTLDFDYGPPPSLESISAKFNPRHDSGNGCHVYNNVVALHARESDPLAQNLALHMSGALPPGESHNSDEREGTMGISNRPASRARNTTRKTGSRKNSAQLTPNNIQDIAPWAESPDSLAPWSSTAGSPDLQGVAFPASSEAFLSSELTGADRPNESANGRTEEVEPKVAALSMTSRQPPSSNAQALAQLEPFEEMKTSDVEAASAKQKKGKGKFMRIPGRG